MITSYSPTALATRSRPTRSTTYSCRAGGSTRTRSRWRTRARRPSRAARPRSSRAPRERGHRAGIWVAISTLRTSTRWRYAPAHALPRRTGANVTAESAPSASPPPCSTRKTSHAWPTSCAITPEPERICATNRRRNAGIRSDANARPNSCTSGAESASRTTASSGLLTGRRIARPRLALGRPTCEASRKRADELCV